MDYSNRRWLLHEHPHGRLQLSNFARTEELISPSLREGEVLLRTSVIHCAPTVRNAMNARVGDFVTAIPLGTVIVGPVGGRVVESRSDAVPVGSRIITRAGWQDYSVVDTRAAQVQVIPPGVTLIDALGPLGTNPLTAYFGVTRIGRPKPGEVMVVSGAAGSTGSIAAQIGSILGCRVIGIAGGSSKCAWLVDELGLEAAIDYKSERVADRLAQLCPQGVDIFYDNVGGHILTDVFSNLAHLARVVVCGQIAVYDGSRGSEAELDMLRLLYGAITVQGFLVRDYAAEFDQARAQIAEWIDAGRVKHREEVREGFEQVPESFRRLFDGSNQGTVLVVIEDDA